LIAVIGAPFAVMGTSASSSNTECREVNVLYLIGWLLEDVHAMPM
jgi:hypothetical protein